MASFEFEEIKQSFRSALKDFAASLADKVTQNEEWTIWGFIDVFKNIYALSPDTKVISKILELHLFPHFLSFAARSGYKLELAAKQNWYPDMTFYQEMGYFQRLGRDFSITIGQIMGK